MAQKRTIRIGTPSRTRAVEVEVPDAEPAIWDADAKLDVVGRPFPRLDGVAKVTGKARYTYDINRPGMLHARVLRCPHPHARLLGVDVSRAAALPGVKAAVAFLSADFFALLGETDANGNPIDTGDKTKAAGPRRLLFAGEEVAAVAATTPEIAEDAVALIAARFEVLPHVVDLEAARLPGAPKVFPKGNVEPPTTWSRGDVEAGFKDADVVVEGTYRTPVALHNALEPHGAVAEWQGGKLTVWASTQGVFGFRDDLAKFFRIPARDVRVITEHLGGGFGAKFGAGVTGVIPAILARKAAAPVKLMLDRQEENLVTGNRPDSVQWLKVGARRDGALTAIQLRSYGTGGTGGGAGVSGPVRMIYACPNVRTEEQDVATNAGPSMPFRAPGFPQGSFALESALDEVADRLGLDPLALRKRNYVDKPAKGLMEQYEAAAKGIGWERRRPAAENAASGTTVRRGFGMGTAVWGMYGGPPADAAVTIHSDGKVECICGSQEIGTGTRTAMAIVTAEVLGLQPDKVSVVMGDTATGMYSPASGGSVTLTSILPAVRAAAEDARTQLLAALARALPARPGDLALSGGVVRDAASGRTIPFAAAAARLQAATITGHAARVANYAGVGIESYGAQFAEVEVDTATGRVRVLKMTAAHDAGRTINRMTAESQVNGGVIMGLSYALLERRTMDSDTGIVMNANLEDYKIAAALEIPEIVPIMTEVFDAANNVGVKGLGEPPVVPTAAAIANAVSNALGVRVRELPLSPDRILDLLASSAKDRGGAA